VAAPGNAALVVGNSIFGSLTDGNTETFSAGAWAPGAPLSDDPAVSIFDGDLRRTPFGIFQFAGVDLNTFGGGTQVFRAGH
jgi:hypothetical protein